MRYAHVIHKKCNVIHKLFELHDRQVTNRRNDAKRHNVRVNVTSTQTRLCDTLLRYAQFNACYPQIVKM